MQFQLRPQVYALLLCSSLTQDPDTGGWIIQPFSEVSVERMPVDLALTIFAQIMGPPGSYELALCLFHATDPEGTAQILPPRPFTIHEGKNVDFVLHIETRITQLGLYMIEAQIVGHHTALSPLRITAA